MKYQEIMRLERLSNQHDSIVYFIQKLIKNS